MSRSAEYEGYRWVKVKRYVMDQNKSWEERYAELETHHIQETAFLIDEIRKLAKEVDEVKGCNHEDATHSDTCREASQVETEERRKD